MEHIIVLFILALCFFSFFYFLYHVLVKLQNKENFSDEYKLMVASCVVFVFILLFQFHTCRMGDAINNNMMWVSKVPNYDAYGLFRALHSHNPFYAPLRSVLNMCHWHIAPWHHLIILTQETAVSQLWELPPKFFVLPP